MINKEKIYEEMNEVAEQISNITCQIEPYVQTAIVPLNNQKHRYLTNEERIKLFSLFDEQKILSERYKELSISLMPIQIA